MAWHARRRNRVRFVREQSRRIGRNGQLEGRLVGAPRNAAVRVTPARVMRSALARMAAAEI